MFTPAHLLIHVHTCSFMSHLLIHVHTCSFIFTPAHPCSHLLIQGLTHPLPRNSFVPLSPRHSQDLSSPYHQRRPASAAQPSWVGFGPPPQCSSISVMSHTPVAASAAPDQFEHTPEKCSEHLFPLLSLLHCNSCC